jgi:hypothetical protein
MARKQIKSGDYFKGKNLSNQQTIELLSSEEGLVYKEELVFEDGTVYKGQVKEDL